MGTERVQDLSERDGGEDQREEVGERADDQNHVDRMWRCPEERRKRPPVLLGEGQGAFVRSGRFRQSSPIRQTG